MRPVRREDGFRVERARVGDPDHAPGRGIRDVDVAVRRVCDQAVACDAERRWESRRTGADIDRDRCEEECDDEQGHPDRSPRNPWRERGTAGDVSHGEPPSWEGPGRTLTASRCDGQDLVSIVGRRPEVQVLEDGGQLPLEASFSGHATCPPGTGVGAGRLGGHGQAHRGERVVQPGLGRPERDAQRCRHLGSGSPSR